jgi:hypothetical protein
VDHVDVRKLRNFWPEFFDSGHFMMDSFCFLAACDL